jgi:hypothetical protein
MLTENTKEKEVKLKSKFWKLPGKANTSKAKQKKNWVGILKVNENGIIEPTRQQIIEQTIMVDGSPRLATPEFINYWPKSKLSLKKYPVIWLPSWSVIPWSPDESIQKSLMDGSNTKGYQLLLNRMKLSNIEQKKAMGGWVKWVIGIGLAALIGYALLTSGGGK